MNAPAEARDHRQVPQADQQTDLRPPRITGHLTQQYHRVSLPASSQPRFHNEVCPHLTAYSSLHPSSVYKSRASEEAAEVVKQHQKNIGARILLEIVSAITVSLQA